MWDDFAEQLALLRDEDRLRCLMPRELQGVCFRDPGGNQILNFGSNDYLGLASAPLPLEADLDRVDSNRVGAAASGLVTGWTDRHQRLADQLADFEQTESAVLFPTGYAACSGAISTLCRSGDLILSDQLNHASLIDGCRLSKAERVVYPHRDYRWVQEYLQSAREKYRRVWIVTDTVFSMDGHVAPLQELVSIAKESNTTLIVDEAHATGILGKNASGACEALGVKSEVAIRIGTLSKAIGSQGGFVACPSVIAEYLVNHCRPLIFSTSLALPAVDAALHSLSHRNELLQRRDRVCAFANEVRETLRIPSAPIELNVPIIPIVKGADGSALAASQRLYELGLFVPAIRPPTVPPGSSRLRVSLSASHDFVMISRLLHGLSST